MRWARLLSPKRAEHFAAPRGGPLSRTVAGNNKRLARSNKRKPPRSGYLILAVKLFSPAGRWRDNSRQFLEGVSQHKAFL